MIFVYRSHDEGLLSQRVRRRPDATVLAWFQRGWTCDDPWEWVEDELGGSVYGLDSIFEEAQDHDLPCPQTTDELRGLLHENLYVEADDDDDYVRLDEHSLRVRTDDDEVELAYYFFDDHIMAAAPDRLAYLLHDSWPLPDASGGQLAFVPAVAFVPSVPVVPATPAAAGEATTYAVFLTFYDGGSLARLRPLAFPGVGLAELAAHLSAMDRPAGDGWPPELRVLWALVTPGDDRLEPALQRCNRWPGFNLNAHPWPALPNDHGAAHRRAMEMLDAAQYIDDRRPDASRLQVSDHIAQLSMHCSASFGYQQWYLFDDGWASHHPHLAQSLLRYANHWDPLD